MLPTLVFVFNGNAFAATEPNSLTQLAADQLLRHGDDPIQVSTPALDRPLVFDHIANYIRKVSHGQPIGLMGFSAGGALAMRLAGQPGLNVTAVMNYYGPPDLNDWLAYHGHDRYYREVTTHVHLTPGIVHLFSGPSSAQTYFVNAFGIYDRIVVSSVSTTSFYRDFQHGQVYTYPGPHGVSLYADYPAFKDFLAHL
jgi:Serine hydrolase (FSH1)